MGETRGSHSQWRREDLAGLFRSRGPAWPKPGIAFSNRCAQEPVGPTRGGSAGGGTSEEVAGLAECRAWKDGRGAGHWSNVTVASNRDDRERAGPRRPARRVGDHTGWRRVPRDLRRKTVFHNSARHRFAKRGGRHGPVVAAAGDPEGNRGPGHGTRLH